MFDPVFIQKEAMRIFGPALVRLNIPLHLHTTLKIGGPADLFFAPDCLSNTKEILHWLSEKKIPYLALGGGSNILFTDLGFRGAILHTEKINNRIIELDRGSQQGLPCISVQVGTGVTTIALVRKAVEQGWQEATFLAGIPGSIGGALVMNAGGHDGEIGNAVTDVRVLTADIQEIELPKTAIGFAYRQSAFPKNTLLLETKMQFSKASSDSLKKYVTEHIKKRANSQPLTWPNAGSFFKNPPGHFAGKLIESAGLKGMQIGCARVSEKHANFLVKDRSIQSHTPGRDFIQLMAYIQQKIFETHQIQLEAEVKVIGER